MKWSTHALLALCWVIVGIGLDVMYPIPHPERVSVVTLLVSIAFALGMHAIAMHESRGDER